MVRVQSVLLTTVTGDFNWRKNFFSSRAYIEKCVLCLEGNDYIKNLPRKELKWLKMLSNMLSTVMIYGNTNDLSGIKMGQYCTA